MRPLCPTGRFRQCISCHANPHETTDLENQRIGTQQVDRDTHASESCNLDHYLDDTVLNEDEFLDAFNLAIVLVVHPLGCFLNIRTIRTGGMINIWDSEVAVESHDIHDPKLLGLDSLAF